MHKILQAGLVLGLSLASSSALAAGAGTGIEAGFTDVGTDLEVLLNGAGGFIVIVLSIALAAIMLAIGRGWGQAVTAMGVALFLGYGVTALQGISGVTGTTDLLSEETLMIEIDPSV